MKIFQIITRLNVGGAALYNILLASHLKKRGHDVWLINGPAGKEEGEMFDYLDKVEVNFEQVFIPEFEREIRPWRDLITLIRLVRLLRKERPTIVHTHTSKAGLLGRFAAILVGVPCRIHSVHGTIFKEFFSPWKSRIFIGLEWLLGIKTQFFLADTDLIRQRMIALHIARPEQIKVLHLGLNLEPFRNLEPFQGFLRKLLKLSATTKIVGTVARLVPIKGIEFLLEAAARLLPKYPDLHFVITGDGELKKQLVDRAAQLGIAKHVTFLGFWKDLRQIYADLDFLVVPSLSEGCPIAVIEGMAAAKPIIGSAVGGIPDVISDGINGLLVPPKDPKSLAEAIIRCLSEKELSRRMGERARQDAFDRFTIAQSVDATEQCYEELFRSSTT